MVPPPMPTMELKKPMDVPIIDCPNLPGSCWNNADLPVLSNMFRAERVAIIPNRTVSQVPSTFVTSKLPASTPLRINGDQRLSRSKLTLPFLWCDRMELRDVGTMVASDVAVATSMAVSADTPKLWNKKNSTGTMTMPPPTPSKPARIPAKIPVAISPRIVVGWLVINSMMFIYSLDLGRGGEVLFYCLFN